MIALHTSNFTDDHYRHEHAIIHPHLYKFRLISRAHAEVGKIVMLSLLKMEEYELYRTLHLPNKLFSPSQILNALANSWFQASIDTIELHPLTIAAHDITEIRAERIVEVESGTYGAWGYDDPDPLEVLEEELWIYLRQWHWHDQFVAAIRSPQELESCVGPLQSLSKELNLKVKVYEYWFRNTLINKYSGKKGPRRAEIEHWRVIPLFVEIVRNCSVRTLHITADSSMFQNMSLETVRSSFAPLGSLTSLVLDVEPALANTQELQFGRLSNSCQHFIEDFRGPYGVFDVYQLEPSCSRVFRGYCSFAQDHA
jgi:hypothetical protein